MGKFDKKNPENIFFGNSMKISKNQNFWFLRKNVSKIENFHFSKFSLNFRRKYFWDFFGRISPILHGRSPRSSELISELECFFWSRFFCASMSVLVVYEKNCLGITGAINNVLFQNHFISLRFLPWEASHLPGPREVLVLIQWFCKHDTISTIPRIKPPLVVGCCETRGGLIR